MGQPARQGRDLVPGLAGTSSRQLVYVLMRSAEGVFSRLAVKVLLNLTPDTANGDTEHTLPRLYQVNHL